MAVLSLPMPWRWAVAISRAAYSRLKRCPSHPLVSNDLTLETSCTDFLVYASAGMITV